MIVGSKPVELEPVDQEEAAEPRRLAGRGADLGPEDVESQGGGDVPGFAFAISRSPCRVTSKKPTVIQTAYWCVRTVVRFIAFCNISVRK